MKGFILERGSGRMFSVRGIKLDMVVAESVMKGKVLVNEAGVPMKLHEAVEWETYYLEEEVLESQVAQCKESMPSFFLARKHGSFRIGENIDKTLRLRCMPGTGAGSIVRKKVIHIDDNNTNVPKNCTHITYAEQANLLVGHGENGLWTAHPTQTVPSLSYTTFTTFKKSSFVATSASADIISTSSVDGFVTVVRTTGTPVVKTASTKKTVFSGLLHGDNLLLGCKNSVVSSTAELRHHRTWRSSTDCISMAATEDAVLCGMRNKAVVRCDMRSPDLTPVLKVRSVVTSLGVTASLLAVRAADSELTVWDLRKTSAPAAVLTPPLPGAFRKALVHVTPSFTVSNDADALVYHNLYTFTKSLKCPTKEEPKAITTCSAPHRPVTWYVADNQLHAF